MANQDDRERRRARLSAKFSKMSARKKAQFERRLKGENRKSNDQSQIRPRRAGEDLLLSFAQSRLWFLTMLDPGGTTYNIPTAASFTGALSAWALERCFNAIITRHESLRTTFTMKDEQPIQRISPPEFRALPVIDLRGLAPACRDREMERQVDLNVSTPFCLTEGPLLRFFVLLMGEGDFTLTMNMHHIVSDGWSLGVMGVEINRLYEAFLFEKEAGLAPLSIQYPDFALWQREWLQGEVLEEQISFWKAQLKTPLPLLELNTDFPRPSIQTNRGSSQSFETSPESAARLRTLCRRLDTTMFNLLLAAVKTLLFRYTSQTDLILGTPVTNRNNIALEPLIGFFINTLALRGDLSGDPSFEVLVGRIKKMSLAAFSHQDVPFERLVEEIQLQRDLSRPPIFQMLFTVHTELPQSVSLPGLSLKPLNFKNHMVKFDIDINLVDRAGGIGGVIDFNMDLFHPETIERMGEHLQVLLESIVADPSRRLSRLSVVAPAERHRCLVTWNQTESDFPGEQPIGILFEMRAGQRPEAVAVSCGESRLTYEVLSRRANHLAAQLERLGVGPETPVGICLAPSDAMVIGLLGILLSGGVYVPLDPVNPPERLAFMLAESGAALLLTDEEQAPHFRNCPVDLLFWEAVNRQTASDFEPRWFSSHQLAYIMFTSGSTGKPKGIAIRHRSVLRRVCEACFLDFRVGEVVAQTSNISFDAATIEIWGALLHGCELTLIPKTLLLSPEGFVAHIRARYVEVILLTPSLFNQIVKEIPDAFAHSGQMLIGGEAADARWMATSLEHGGPRRLLHGYGPTENTTLASWYQVDRVDADAAGLSIGRPVDNAQIFLVDPWLNPVPLGAGGELLVGGDGLARGYWSQPALTAERFIPHPFATEAGSRLYRSGDLVRYLPSGNMIFMGRLDFQIKIRGVRFEPGEVEALLSAHPKVKDAVVLLRTDGPAEARLVAYVAGRAASNGEDAADVLPTELRLYLKDRLPDYMIPSALVILDQLPLNPNGKIDRGALPAPGAEAAAQVETYTAPQTSTQEIVAAIQARVLGLPRLGIHDNFFEKGGHSLLATQVLSRIRKSFGLALPLRLLFEATTVVDLARRIDEENRNTQGLTEPPLIACERPAYIPLSFAQQRLWFLDQLEAGGSSYNIPASVLISGTVDVSALEISLATIVQRHESLRTVFHSQGEDPEQVILAEAALDLKLIDLGRLEATRGETLMKRLSRKEGSTPFDLSRGPLLRTALLRLGGDRHAFLQTMHHIISDGWSMNVFVRELGELYGALVAGLPAALTELTLQYADFSLWQRRWLQGETLANQVDFWKAHLVGPLPVLEIPTDRPRPLRRTFDGDHVAFEIDAGTTEAWLTLGTAEGGTLFMTLLAAFQTLLHRYSQQNDMVVGSPIANRNRSEIEPLIGFFVNTLALRGDLSGNPSFLELLARTRQTTLAAYSHQDLPFEKLVEELQPDRDLARSPLFQAFFVLQNTGPLGLNLPGLELSALPGEGEMAKFDLNLTMVELEHGLAGSLNYNVALFDKTTVIRFVDHFKRLLAEIVAQSELPLGRLSLLSPRESRLLLQTWNETAREMPPCSAVQQAFERVADQYPDRVCLVFDDRRLSFGEVNRRAELLADRLADLGVGDECVVGIGLERSSEMILSLLAVLKSGGAYLPLDPGLPTQRLEYMLADSGVRVLITQPHWASRLDQSRLGLTLCEPMVSAAEVLPRMVRPRNGEQLAYVMYTSGSTGRPKGVAVEHRNLINYVNAILIRLELSSCGSFAVVSTLAADLGNTMLFPPLWQGAELHVLSRDRIADPDLFGAYMTQRGVDALKITPSHLRALSHGSEPARVLPRKILVLGGEATPATLVNELRHRAPNLKVYNHYGPTETTVGVLTFAAEGDNEAFPLGRPLPNTRIYLLDRHLQAVPLGMPGELYVGGRNLTRGYVNLPAQTADRFGVDPFGGGERLYRTGDLARYRENGTIDFLGRADDQIKLRGYRIEPGEIEKMLRGQVGIAEAFLRVLGAKEKRLVAYLRPESAELVNEKGGSSLEAPILEDLKRRLPEYMVPAAMVFIKRFPLNPNGKIDRSALPEPYLDGGGAKGVFRAPEQLEERQLAEIFADVLGVASVGLDDDFFKLGGHSLLATRAVSAIRRVFGRSVPLRYLFEAPTVALLAARLETAVPVSQTQVPPLTATRGSGDSPLSFAQQRMWFLDRLAPDGSSYNTPVSMQLHGRLDVNSLRLALDRLVERHEILRTVFPAAENEPVQRVLTHRGVPFVLVDLSGLENRRSWGRAVLTRAGLAPFNLAEGPLFCVLVVRQTADVHFLLLRKHHIISDGWSNRVFVREIGSGYSDLVRGRHPQLDALALQYADFALWQRRWLRGAVLAAELAFWRERLEGHPPLLELPTDRPRPVVQSNRGAGLPFELPPLILERARAFAERRQASLFMVLLTAYQLCLSRYSGQEDVVVGTPIANRNHPEIEPLIGFFVNTLALRTRLSGPVSFARLVSQVRNDTLEAYQHQDLPFDKLVEELQPERDLSHAPVFQVVFGMHQLGVGDPELPGLRLSPLAGENPTAKYDLTLSLWEEDGGLAGAVEYATDLFDRATIVRFCRHFNQLTAAALTEPDRAVGRLPFLLPEERHLIVSAWNDTASDYLSRGCLNLVFEDQAGKTPDSVAIHHAGENLTYAELERQTATLANELIQWGMVPDTPVAVCCEAGLNLAVALLAVIRAGCAYVPLDAAYPAERISYMLADSGAALILVQEDLEDLLPSHWLPTLYLNRRREQTTAPVIPLHGDSLAYLIYTSGSTGKPKGTAIAHRGVLRLVINCDYVPLHAGDRLSQMANISFDAVTFELWGALLHGGCVVVIPKGIALDPPAFALEIRRQAITAMFMTVALFNQVARHEPDAFARLHHLMVGGEAVDPLWFRTVMEAGPPRRFFNIYGPTECTTFSTVFHVDDVGPDSLRIPIGRPIANTLAYIVDDRAEIVPVGVCGELWLGGPGLARAYWNRPGLTAEKFVADPFSSESGSRLYRSGDLVRFTANGAIEFLGRIDSQVKIRGFRIELEEIEAVLMDLGPVEQAVVLAREDVPGEKRLVAYVVGPSPEAMRGSEIVDDLKSRLPEYMLPAQVMVLEAMPLTANGKIDRRGLPAVEPAESGPHFQAPRNAGEELLAQIFAEILNLPRVGTDDNFFDLGGHSLLATRVMSRIRQTFGLDLQLRVLFEAPTVIHLAAELERARRRGSDAAEPALGAVARMGHPPLSFAQQRLWFLDRLEPNSPFYNIPLAAKISGVTDITALETALNDIGARHESLRTTFGEQDEVAVQLIEEPAPRHLKILDLNGLSPQRASRLAADLVDRDAATGFDLGRSPLLRCCLIRLSQAEAVFSLNMHHIIADGWSMGVLVNELAAFYRAALTGQSPFLEPLTLQYADFAVWQRSWLSGAVLRAQLDYWKGQLGGELPVLEMPTDRPRPLIKTYGGHMVPLSWPAELHTALAELNRTSGSTLFMSLLAAFKVLLWRYSGQRDVVIGSPIANRNRAEIEPLIGFFVNTLALRAPIRADDSFRSLLARMRHTTLDAYAHQDLPFEKLVEEIQPDRDPGRSPVFQVMFALQNNSVSGQSLPGLRFEPYGSEKVTAKYDLTLTLWEEEASLAGALEYNTDLFSEQTAQTMLARLKLLLQAALAEPDRKLGDLPLMDEAERGRVVSEWNRTEGDYPREKTIHALLEAVVSRYPQRAALDFHGRVLSYGLLWRWSTLLANRLIRAGLRRGEPVGVALESSPQAVAAMLAILRAGGGYLPLDPSHPIERLQWMLTHSGARTFFHDAGESDGAFNGELQRIDLGPPPLVDESPSLPQQDGGPHDLAYIIYTSGSTGRPKGVAVGHRAVVSLLCGSDYMPWQGDERLIQAANISFDAATFEIWGPLLHGGALLGTEREILLDPARFAAFLKQRRITTMFLTTALFNQMVREIANVFSGLRTLLFGGEAVDPSLVARMYRGGVPERLLHVYGPTETTTFASWFPVVEASAETVPIGGPLTHTTLHVLDASGHLLPSGITGQLFIGGDGLARAYWRQPAKTAEVFVPDPFSSLPGARLYASGDLVRRGTDGAVSFVGRVDHQVKIRGFRIEPGEIEQVIKTHDLVADALVLVRDQGPTGRRLIAYAVAPGLPVEALRLFLRERLPEYMVPAVLIPLETFPLTANGKIDRKSLPEPREDQTAPEDGIGSPFESLLADIFASVLGRERVGRDQNFFELGGHSLLATRVISRIRQNLRVDLPLRALFESPTVAGMARLAEEGARSQGGLEAVPMVPRDIVGPIPLSFAQQRLWFLDRLEPGHASYNIPLFGRFRGWPDLAALNRTLSLLVKRHESLRTTFRRKNDVPMQWVHPPVPIRLPVLDVSGLEGERRENSVSELVKTQMLHAFRLDEGPLFHAAVIRIQPDEHVFLLNLHHIIADGWSLGVLGGEINRIYRAFLEEPHLEIGENTEWLPPLSIQYPDFALWQRRWFASGIYDRLLAYWKERLAGPLPQLELLTDYQRPAVKTHRGGRVPIVLSGELADRLQRHCTAGNATPFMVLQAAFKALLHRYTNQTDIVVGTPIANRNRAELEPLIGFFVNTLALRDDLSGDPDFDTLLERVRETTLSAYTHQDLPFEKLVEELQPERDLSRSPLFQVMFVYQNNKIEDMDLPGLSPVPMGGGTELAKFDLTLTLGEMDQTIAGTLEYNWDLYKPSTVECLRGHYLHLLEELLVHSQTALNLLQVMPDAERRRVLYAWNETAHDYPSDHHLCSIFQRRVREQPDALAVSYGDRSLSYAALDQLTDKAAAGLRQAGVGPEVPVGIFMLFSPECIAGILSIVKAGGFYVPLDTSYPKARLMHMIEDSGVLLVITRQEQVEQLPEHEAALWLWDRELQRPRAEFSADDANFSGEHAAYMIYTSGSTGLPKGTVVPHRAVLRTAFNPRFVEIQRNEKVAQTINIAFDVAVAEIWCTLLRGGHLVGIDKQVLMSPADLAQTIETLAISTLFTTTAVLNEMARDRPKGFARLRNLQFGGEAADLRWVRRILAHGPPAHLNNGYGPTESTAASSLFTVRNLDPRADSVPIGKPLASSTYYILDSNLRPMPLGTAGELCIGGDGLARSYWRRPEVTAEKFVPHAWSSKPGDRLYRSGDLVRFLDDGNAAFLGRIDFQVKVRGFRVELREIETVLVGQSSVENAVVVPREDLAGSLAAYVQPVDGAGSERDLEADLMAILREKLPEYMVPSVIVTLASFPLTPNGKIDRKALPKPNLRQAEDRDWVEPHTETERAVAAIFGQILNRERVGLNHHFFRMGGHSLLATQLVSRIRRDLGVELPLRLIFENPTVAGVARRLGNLSGVSLESIPPVSRQYPLPLSYAQQRLWFLDRFQPGSSLYNMPSVLRLQGCLDVVLLSRSFEALAARHEILRTTIGLRDGKAVQEVHPAAISPLKMVDLSKLDEAEGDRCSQAILVNEVSGSFDLSRGPLVRVLVLKSAPTRFVLAVNMHHIISDGWSIGIFVREWSGLYETFQNDQPQPFEPLAIQYGDFSAWQRQHLSGETMAALISYWRRRLGDVPSVLDLPTDFKRPAVQTHAGRVYPFSLPGLPQMEAFCRSEGVTAFMWFLAGLQALLYRYSGQTRFSVGSPIANRNRAEIEPLIGFFVNTLALRADLDGNPDLTQLLGRVRETTLGAYAHQDLPFEKLVEELQPQRNMSHSPLFQVMFVLQNQMETGAAADEAVLPGVRLLPMAVERHSAKFDITISLSQTQAGFSGNVEYNRDLFLETTIAAMCGHYGRLLERWSMDPGLRVGDLDFLSTDERRLMLEDWNRTRTDYEAHLNIPAVFERQRSKQGDSAALIDGRRTLTYDDLGARADAYARRLLETGLSADQPVCLFADPGIEALIAFLAILKAGAAYLPLDPQYPAERLAYMMADSAAALLVTGFEIATRLPDHRLKTVFLEDLAGTTVLTAPVPVPAPAPDQLAYIIYTSGSTGSPKGTAIPHRAVLRLVRHVNYFVFDRFTRLGQFSNLSFDAVTFEVWGALLNGGSCSIFSKETLLSGSEFEDKIRREYINTFLLTVALFNQIIARNANALEGVSQVMSGGEALNPHWVRVMSLHRGPDRFLNAYGPTECTTIALTERVETVPEGAAGIPIGRPIANTDVHVVDARGRLVPVGVAGELLIGGDGLARGYWFRPGLTAEKFVPHPFATHGGLRLYRSGDLCRRLADGRVDFLGRIDQQIKLRGFRIELPEIEAALKELTPISDAVVLLRTEDSGDRRLAAFVTLAGDRVSATATPPTSLWSESLKKRLPDYMIPAAFVILEQFPLTPNGKVDRKRLSEDEVYRPVVSAAAEPVEESHNPVEEILANGFARVLELERVGRRDNFFNLGGHSLLAVQLISFVREHLGVVLPLRQLFESPSVAELALRVAALRACDSNLAVPPLIPTATVSGGTGWAPLSFAQQRLWFLDRLDPGRSIYNMPFIVELEGRFDAAALQWSLDRLCRRQQSLRTTFAQVAETGQVRQIVDAATPSSVPLIDVTGLPEEEGVELAGFLAGREVGLPFDLERGPLWRVRLFRRRDDRHFLCFTMHHIISDGWSMGVFVREFCHGYQGYGEDPLVDLPELPIQYSDFSAWQRGWLCGENLQTMLNYWSDRLGGDLPFLEMPTRAARPAVQTFSGNLLSFQIPTAAARRLLDFGQHHGATPFMVLLAAYQVLLSRYSGQTTILVGSPMAGRSRSELEGLIGFFVNTLVYGGDLSGEPCFREALARIREVALGAFSHQELPFERLVERLQPARDLSRSPFFQTLFTLQTQNAGGVRLPGVTGVAREPQMRTAKFELSMSLTQGENGLLGSLEYNTDLFAKPAMMRLLIHFRNLLSALGRDPEMPISRLDFLTAEEKHAQVVAWNQTATTFPRGLTVPDAFRRMVEKYGDAMAVNHQREGLSYAQLNRQSDSLAAHLCSLGLKREEPVVIGMASGLSFAVSLLAVLKAGGVYLPLDPGYPKQRLLFIVADSAARIVLTQSAHGDAFDMAGVTTLLVDREFQNTDRVLPAVDPVQLAYLIYTSGSTGRPKGVGVPHRAILRLVREHAGVPFHARDRVSQLVNISFDVVTFEVWGALLNGACLEVFQRDLLLAPEHLSLETRRRAITVMFLNTALFNRIIEVVPDGFHSVETMVVGGEALDPHAMRLALNAKAPARLINGYGPTECTAFASWFHLQSLAADAARVSIGVPWSNTDLHILDPRLQLLPPGAWGELCLGGEGLARGYWERPALTAERFVPHPFAAHRGRRLYRSGDLCRYLPDGAVDFLGRLDHQVKIRGFRIETGEIETLLDAHERVKEAVVLAREDRPGDKRLVAYIRADRLEGESETVEFGVDEAELKSLCEKQLPEVMVPSAFVLLADFPLTPNQKVDRKALPRPERDERDRALRVAPGTATERRLLKLWERVLNLPDLGVTDQFFELGGHSLLAVKLMAAIKIEFRSELAGRDLPLALLFQAPTVQTLAARLTETGLQVADHLVCLQSEGTELPLFLVHAVGGEVMSYAGLARLLGQDRPVYGLRAEAGAGKSLEAMATRYIEELRSVQKTGPYLLGGWSMGGVLALEMAHQLVRQGESVAQLLLLDSYLPPVAEQKPNQTAVLHTFLMDVAGIHGKEVPADLGAELACLADLEAEERLERALDGLERQFPLVLERPQLRAMWTVFHQNLNAYLNYRPKPFKIPCLLVVAAHSPGRISNDPIQPWQALASTTLTVRELPATHYSLLTPPVVNRLAELLRSRLETTPAADS